MSLLHTAKPESLGASLSARARSGGLLTQLLFAGAHLAAHLGTAIALMLLLELATETFIRRAATLCRRCNLAMVCEESKCLQTTGSAKAAGL